MKNTKEMPRTAGRSAQKDPAVTTDQPRAVVGETTPPFPSRDEMADFATMLNRLCRSTQEEIAALHHEAGSMDGGISDPQLAVLIGRQVVFLRHIENALHRISTGAFGRCMACGRTIERSRLMAVPITRLCTACKGN